MAQQEEKSLADIWIEKLDKVLMKNGLPKSIPVEDKVGQRFITISPKACEKLKKA